MACAGPSNGSKPSVIRSPPRRISTHARLFQSCPPVIVGAGSSIERTVALASRLLPVM
jgi:hypothetical protein